MKILILNVLLVISILSAKSENLHTPAELMKMMIDSKMSYSVEMLENDSNTECKDYSKIVNYQEFFRNESKNEILTLAYKYGEKDKKLLEKAEHAFRNQILDSAIYYYEKTLEENPSLFKIYTYIGQVYNLKRDFKKAIEWYNKAIDSNYIDYMAHWFIANSYANIQEYDKAKEEIVIAHILNRNHNGIKSAMKKILELQNFQYVDWCFNPKYEINKISDDNISIKANAKWMLYANFKAFWKYEPGYKISMGGKENSFSTTEEKECLMPIIFAIDKNIDEYKGDLQFEMLLYATNNKQIQEYILFEIFLPPTPLAAYQFSKETILGIKDYVLKTRIKKI